MNDTIEAEQEADGRWLPEVLDLPSVLAEEATLGGYPKRIAVPRPTRRQLRKSQRQVFRDPLNQAPSKAEALALRVLAERQKTK